MSNRHVDFFGVYTITNMLDKKLQSFSQTYFQEIKKISFISFFLYVEYMNSYMKITEKFYLHGT
jgi:hypothetical protein